MDGNHDAGNEEEEEEEDDDRNEEYDDDGGDGEGSEESEESEAEYADVDLDRNPHSIDFLYNVFQGCTPRWPANADNIWDPSNVTWKDYNGAKAATVTRKPTAHLQRFQQGHNHRARACAMPLSKRPRNQSRKACSTEV